MTIPDYSYSWSRVAVIYRRFGSNRVERAPALCRDDRRPTLVNVLLLRIRQVTFGGGVGRRSSGTINEMPEVPARE